MTARRRHHRCRGGWSLIHLVIVMGLTGVGLLLASKLLMTSLHVHRTTADQLTRANRRNHAVATLRRDVWNSTSVEVEEDKALLIRQPAGRHIAWRLDRPDDDGLGELHRTVIAQDRVVESRTWTGIGPNAAFSVDGSVVMLLTDRLGVAHANRQPFVSQLTVAQGEER